jgi:hypothetical protein
MQSGKIKKSPKLYTMRKGNRKDPGSDKGISRLSAVGKIFSAVLAGRLNDWLGNRKALLEFQSGFVKEKRTTDNIFIITTTIDKYLRFKRGHIYWRFFDL